MCTVNVPEAVEMSYRQNDTSKWRELVELIDDVRETIIPDCGSQISLEIARCLSSFTVQISSNLQIVAEIRIST